MNEFKKGDGQTLNLILSVLKQEGFIVQSLKSIDKSYYFDKVDQDYIFKKIMLIKMIFQRAYHY